MLLKGKKKKKKNTIKNTINTKYISIFNFMNENSNLFTKPILKIE